MAYEREFGPLGPERGDWQAAVVASTVATMLSSGKGRGPRLQDFILRWGARKPRQTVEEQLNIFRGIAARFKTKDE